MRKFLALFLLVPALMIFAGCHGSASNGSTTVTINPTQLPKAVESAFSAEHPYAQPNSPIKQMRTNRGSIYVIPFPRRDGSTGTATYTSFGELVKDE